MDALRRPGEPTRPPGGRTGRGRNLRAVYGDDVFPVETVLVFHRSGRETRAAVKVAEGMWRVTGSRWLRRWDGLLRAVGPGYQLSLIE
jgi:hypothetical protein